MENGFLNARKFEFTVPSGYKYVIREQNGADDDILSNPVEARTLRNISRFIAAIVVSNDYTQNGKLTVDDAHQLPVLDKYCIMFNSRMFSMGETVEFEHDWGDGGGAILYAQDLKEFLFDYGVPPTEEELLEKPLAIPYYPNGKKVKDIEFTTSYSNKFKFDVLTGEGESYIANLPDDKRTKNQELVARNLHLEVDGKWEKVTNFRMFSVKEMAEIRKEVYSCDPDFSGNTEVENPRTGEKGSVNLLAIKGFFYPGEM